MNRSGDSILYRSGMNAKIKRNFQVFSACDFIAAITQHIPDKRFQMVRYYGWYSNKMRGQRRKRAEEAQEKAACESAATAQQGCGALASAAIEVIEHPALKPRHTGRPSGTDLVRDPSQRYLLSRRGQVHAHHRKGRRERHRSVGSIRRSCRQHLVPDRELRCVPLRRQDLHEFRRSPRPDHQRHSVHLPGSIRTTVARRLAGAVPLRR